MALFGYEFKNEALARTALTTPAFRMDHPEATDNQRLEFLGDSILNFLAAERLYAAKPAEKEGSLTVRRTHLVSTAALCAAAGKHGLVRVLRRNRNAAELPRNSKTLADAIEAIIGAAYLDGGLEAARTVFDSLELFEHAGDGEWSENPKGELQVRSQAMNPPRRPEYELLSVTGKAHEPVFAVKVFVEGLGAATASARTRKEAESEAARKLLSGGNW